jgi:hypothetical protein
MNGSGWGFGCRRTAKPAPVRIGMQRINCRIAHRPEVEPFGENAA